MDNNQDKIKIYLQAMNRLRTNQRQRAFTKIVSVLTE